MNLNNNAFSLAKRQGYIEETTRPRTGRGRGPSFGREVVAPVLVFGLTFGAFLGGSVMSAAHWGDWYNFAWSFALCGGGAAGFVAAWFALPHYWDLQFDREWKEIPPAETPAAKVRPIVPVDDNTKIVMSKFWRAGWQAKLARLTHDRAGQWIAGDKPQNRDMFKPLIMATTTNYRAALDDLRRLGWLDDNDYWTDAARVALGELLSYTSGG